ncbi:hypothetical protein GPX89_42020 [Nocardia sp. ET3-3]|uniref:Uncharacterized protein n=1 Tax=Nocardia terrae TaxID=2675851 RepID=A0A7K1VB50_9NOCA|nr:hypothetical protein [Nocardia terrae]MVU83797.1 hypothetical protein [Nocardia terrae]
MSVQLEVSDRSRNRVLMVLAASLLILIVYWVLWFSARGAVASNDRPAYIEFENAFPLADAWLAVCVLAAAIALITRHATTLLWLLAGGGSAIYLFCLDALYDLENGIWWRSGAGGLIELGINVITLAVGVGLLRWTWRRRTALTA